MYWKRTDGVSLESEFYANERHSGEHVKCFALCVIVIVQISLYISVIGNIENCDIEFTIKPKEREFLFKMNIKPLIERKT